MAGSPTLHDEQSNLLEILEVICFQDTFALDAVKALESSVGRLPCPVAPSCRLGQLFFALLRKAHKPVQPIVNRPGFEHTVLLLVDAGVRLETHCSALHQAVLGSTLGALITAACPAAVRSILHESPHLAHEAIKAQNIPSAHPLEVAVRAPTLCQEVISALATVSQLLVSLTRRSIPWFETKLHQSGSGCADW